jgi:ATP-dependent RNA helicase DDX21
MLVAYALRSRRAASSAARAAVLLARGKSSVPLAASAALEAELEGAPREARRHAAGARAAGAAAQARDEERGEENDDRVDADEAVVDDDEEEEVVTDESALVGNFGMSPQLESRLVELGIKALFPVQAATFSRVQEGQDLIVRSRTGSGKTLAFVLPVVDRIYKAKPAAAGSGPRALIVLPTRELALQVQKEVERVAPRLRCVSVYGGAPAQGQMAELRRGADVVVGTPGRLNDMLNRDILTLRGVQTVILDEADEMLRMGFQDDMDAIFERLPDKSKRQTLLFSATVAPEVRAIADDLLNKGEMVDLVGDSSVKIPQQVELLATPCAENARFDAVAAILEAYLADTRDARALVFVPLKSMCHDLARHPSVVSSGVSVQALNGDMPQRARESALQAFRDGRAKVLVATDVAARGLDIPAVELVVHYSIPKEIDSFVHRAGRTGRAGRSGTNVLLHNSKSELRPLEKFIGASFRMRAVPGGREIAARRAKGLAERVAAAPLDAVARYEAAALELLEARLAKAAGSGAAAAGLDDETKRAVTRLISASLSVASGSADGVTEFSAINGARDTVTLVYTAPGNARLPGPHAIRRTLAGEIDALVERATKLERDAIDDMPNALSRDGDYIRFYAVAKEGNKVLVDVHPAVAPVLLRDARFRALGLNEDTPETHPVPERSGGSMNGAGFGRGGSSFGRGGFRGGQGGGGYGNRGESYGNRGESYGNRGESYGNRGEGGFRGDRGGFQGGRGGSYDGGASRGRGGFSRGGDGDRFDGDRYGGRR